MLTTNVWQRVCQFIDSKITRLLVRSSSVQSLALEKAKREISELKIALAQAQEDATIDHLTGIFNRRGAEDALLREVRSIQREMRDTIDHFPLFGIIILDLDGFKKVNDIYGHSAGDMALQEIVKTIAHIFRRPTDIVCRWGGDEFLMITSNTSLDQTIQMAERCRVAITENVHLHFNEFHVTGSIGISALKLTENTQPEEIQANFENAVREADIAAYRSKQNGKNSVSHNYIF
ncbi:MAG TPA: GGDEF domain-containing protein [Patescibacteria group bacterium]|nr:GGDEF domain-containing protein [Patescibacteria group bacterium]